MTQSILRQVLTIFETAASPVPLPKIARELGISQAQLDGMIQHWVRKGKIRQSSALTECGSCGHGSACPFVLALPRTYELVSGDTTIPLTAVGITCPPSLEKD